MFFAVRVKEGPDLVNRVILGIWITFAVYCSQVSAKDLIEQDVNRGWRYCWVEASQVQSGRVPSCQLHELDDLQYFPSRSGYLLVLQRAFDLREYQFPVLHMRIRASFEAYFNGQLIGSRGLIDNDATQLMGRYDRLLPVTADEKVGSLTLVIASARLRTGLGRNYEMGEYLDITTGIFQRGAIEMVFAFLCIITGLLALCFMLTDWRQYCYLWAGGILHLLDGVWITAYLHEMVRITIGATSAWIDYLRYWSMFLWPLPMIILLCISQTGWIRRVAQLVLMASGLFALAVLICAHGLDMPIFYLNRYCKALHLILVPIVGVLLLVGVGRRPWNEKIGFFSLSFFCLFDVFNSMSILFYKIIPSLSHQAPFAATTNQLIRFYRESEALKFNQVGILVSSLTLIIIAIWETFRKLRSREQVLKEMEVVNQELADTRNSLIASESFKQLAKAAQMMAHDIRRPFSMMRAVLRLGGDFSDLPIPQAKKHITHALDHADALIEDILEVSRPADVKRRRCHLQDIIYNSLVEVFAAQRESFRIVLSLHHNQELFVDEVQLQRALANIMQNAAQALDDGDGMCTIRSSLNASQGLRIELENNGAPIEGDLQQLFEPFAKRPGPQGSGLGLSIVRKYVEAHGGSIHCQRSDDEFTRFVMMLPAECLRHEMAMYPFQATFDSQRLRLGDPREESEADQQAKLIELVGDRTLSLLLVDDEPLYLDSLCAQIRQWPSLAGAISIFMRDTYAGAAQFIESHPVDMAIFDLDLGSGSRNGMALARLLRGKYPQASICLHTNLLAGVSQDTDGPSVDFFLAKPMKTVDFFQLLQHSLQKSQVPLKPPSQTGNLPNGADTVTSG